tara:strand:- start:1291 stop:1830 length:540 start_codon:yes stop_codon:yes gene_type:complete
MDTDERYENGVIYTIKTVDGIYVGSTVDFINRKSTHANRVKSGRMTLLYQNILKNQGEYTIEIHKMYPCKNKIELVKEEQRVSEELNANLNTYRCYVPPEIMKQERNAYYKEYSKTYIRPRIKCECGVEMRKDNLKRHLTTESHKKKMISKCQKNLIEFLIKKPTENIVLDIACNNIDA